MRQTHMMAYILLVTGTNISGKKHSSKSLWIDLDFIIHNLGIGFRIQNRII